MINEASREPRVIANGIIVSNDGYRRVRTVTQSDTSHCEMEHRIVWHIRTIHNYKHS